MAAAPVVGVGGTRALPILYTCNNDISIVIKQSVWSIIRLIYLPESTRLQGSLHLTLLSQWSKG